MFDEEILADPLIKGGFNRALALLDHAANGTLVPGMKENMVFFTTSERRQAHFSFKFQKLCMSISHTIMLRCL